jgi:hypothetical protein
VSEATAAAMWDCSAAGGTGIGKDSTTSRETFFIEALVPEAFAT